MAQYVNAGGSCRLLTEVYGDPGKPWLILSNCLAADHTMWSDQISWLAQRHRVLGYDTRGHGASDPPTQPFELADLAADVVAIMDHYRIDTASFLGLSIGGMTGLGLALAHPERVSRLVCCCARSDAPPPFRNGWTERISRVEAGGIAGILPDTLTRWVSDDFRAANPQAVATLSNMLLGTSATGYIACARALQGLSYREQLHRLTTPTMFVAGGDDAAAPLAAMQEMAKMTPGAEFAVITGARHLANVDKPAGFRAATEAFINAA